MTHASLFSGIGGAEVAAARMGWRNVFHCEIQEFPRKVLDFWFPKAESYEDITKTDFSKWGGQIDVLTGGFPCQPFSLAGRRKGEADNRYLWQEMHRAIREIKPTWVVGENVAGITTMVESSKETCMGRQADLFEESDIYREESRFTLDRICQDLEDAGYEVQPIVIPACAVGAPHRRDRIWIIAHRTDAGTQAVQQERQDGVLPDGHASDTDSYGHGDRQDKQKPVAWSCRETDPRQCSEKRTPANTHELGNNPRQASAGVEGSRSHRLPKQSQRSEPTKRTDGLLGFSQPDPDTSSKGLEGMHEPRGGKGERQCLRRDTARRSEEDNPQDWWRDFPTQSPVCRGNDGLPFDVDSLSISFPKWRKESIKAYGNAWVPQVAYEIFRAIEKISKQQEQ